MITIARPLPWSRQGALALAIWLCVPWPGHATTPDTLSARLELLWSAPVTLEQTPEGKAVRSEGISLRAGAVSPDGRVVFLGYRPGDQKPGHVLLLDAERGGPDTAIPLVLTPSGDPPGQEVAKQFLSSGARPNRDPGVYSLAIGAGGEIWLGGSSNTYMTFASSFSCNAWLAKLGGPEKSMWDRVYGWGCPHVDSIAPDAAGGAVVVGHDGIIFQYGSWLGRIAPDGALLGEHRFGTGKGAAVVRLRDGRFLVAGFSSPEAQGKIEMDTRGRDNVSTWLLDKAGALHGPKPIWDTIEPHSVGMSGFLIASAAEDGAYVAVNWINKTHNHAVEIIHVDSNGALLWRRGLPDTIGVTREGANPFGVCKPALATLANGDALAACALNHEIQLHQLNRDTGEVKAVRLPLPECQHTDPFLLSLMVRQDGTIFLAGAARLLTSRTDCTWLGRLIL